jgi:hypothetical protein
MLGLAAVQTLLMTFALAAHYGAPVPSLGEWAFSVGGFIFLAIVLLGAQGLMISSLVQKTQRASSAAPLLIPQLIFSGASLTLVKSSE